MSKPDPKVDPRRAEKLFAELLARAQTWIPDWQPSGSERDFGHALLRVAARLSSEVTERLDRTPAKAALGLLDWLGITRQAGHAARMPVVFKMTDNASDAVLAPARARIQANVGDSPIAFETQMEVQLVPAPIRQLVGVDPDADAIYFPPTNVLSLEPPALGPTEWTVKSLADTNNKKLQLTPPLGLEKDTIISVDSVEYRIVSEPNGDIVTIVPPVEKNKIEKDTKVQKVTTFIPFGGNSRNLQEHALYIGDEQALKLASPQKIIIEDGKKIPDDLKWEYWGKLGETDPDWNKLDRSRTSTGDLQLEFPQQAEAKSVSIEKLEINGRSNYWIRARRDAVNGSSFSFEKLRLKINCDAEEKDCERAESPAKCCLDKFNSIDKTENAKQYKMPKLEGVANNVSLVLNERFYPLGKIPRQLDSFYLSCAEAFSKPGAGVCVHFEMTDSTLKALSIIEVKSWYIHDNLEGYTKFYHVYGAGQDGFLHRYLLYIDIGDIPKKPILKYIGPTRPAAQKFSSADHAKPPVIIDQDGRIRVVVWSDNNCWVWDQKNTEQDADKNWSDVESEFGNIGYDPKNPINIKQIVLVDSNNGLTLIAVANDGSLWYRLTSKDSSWSNIDDAGFGWELVVPIQQLSQSTIFRSTFNRVQKSVLKNVFFAVTKDNQIIRFIYDGNQNWTNVTDTWNGNNKNWANNFIPIAILNEGDLLLAGKKKTDSQPSDTLYRFKIKIDEATLTDKKVINFQDELELPIKDGLIQGCQFGWVIDNPSNNKSSIDNPAFQSLYLLFTVTTSADNMLAWWTPLDADPKLEYDDAPPLKTIGTLAQGPEPANSVVLAPGATRDVLVGNFLPLQRQVFSFESKWLNGKKLTGLGIEQSLQKGDYVNLELLDGTTKCIKLINLVRNHLFQGGFLYHFFNNSGDINSIDKVGPVTVYPNPDSDNNSFQAKWDGSSVDSLTLIVANEYFSEGFSLIFDYGTDEVNHVVLTVKDYEDTHPLIVKVNETLTSLIPKLPSNEDINFHIYPTLESFSNVQSAITFDLEVIEEKIQTTQFLSNGDFLKSGKDLIKLDEVNVERKPAGNFLYSFNKDMPQDNGNPWTLFPKPIDASHINLKRDGTSTEVLVLETSNSKIKPGFFLLLEYGANNSNYVVLTVNLYSVGMEGGLDSVTVKESLTDINPVLPIDTNISCYVYTFFQSPVTSTIDNEPTVYINKIDDKNNRIQKDTNLYFLDKKTNPKQQRISELIDNGEYILASLSNSWITPPNPLIDNHYFAINASQSDWTKYSSDVETKPDLSWEYWNGSGWWKIEKIDDGTLDLKQSGALWFKVPLDIQQTEVLGRKSWWIRGRLIGGDYGKESYDVKTKGSEPDQTQSIVVNTDNVHAPLALGIRLAYSLCTPIAPQNVLTFDSKSWLDQSDANRTRGAIVDAFVPVAERLRQLSGLMDSGSKSTGIDIVSCSCSQQSMGTLVNTSSKSSGIHSAILQKQAKPTDETSSKVLSITPARNATDTAIDTTIQASFSEPMDPESINISTFQLRDYSDVLLPATVTYNAENKIAMLMPEQALAQSKTYTATIRGGSGDSTVSTQSGNPIPADVTWSFTTAASSSRAIYLTFDKEIKGSPIRILFLLEDRNHDQASPMIVEALRNNRFEPVTVEDKTRALGESGLLTLLLDSPPSQSELFGITGFWLRLRPGNSVAVANWSPCIRGAYVNAVWAEAAETQELEILGSSDGSPLQQFTLTRPPVLGNSLELRIREPLGDEELEQLAKTPGKVKENVPGLPGRWVLWQEVVDPGDEDADARVYALDPASGQIRFGDGAHGAIPPIGRDAIVAFAYTHGGEASANRVPPFTPLNLVSPIAGVEAALAPDQAAGGSDPEVTQTVLRFAAAKLRHRNRAITLRDLEDIALNYSADIAQTRAFTSAEGIRLVVVMGNRDPNRPFSNLADPDPSQAVKRELGRYLLDHASPGLAKSGVLKVEKAIRVPFRIQLYLRVPSLDVTGSVGKAVKQAVDVKQRGKMSRGSGKTASKTVHPDMCHDPVFCRRNLGCYLWILLPKSEGVIL